MSDFEIFRSADLSSLRTLPRLTRTDGESLERLLLLAPDVALATASAVIRTHQPDLHELLFPQRDRERPEIGKLARAVVYLGLAIAAPGQGRIIPILTKAHLRDAQAQVRTRLALWTGAVGGRDLLENDSLPDPELRRVVDLLVERFAARSARDPLWLRAIAYCEAGAFYATLAGACVEQFGGAVDLESVVGNLQRVARTRDLLEDALAGDDERPVFRPDRHAEAIARLRRYGWEEYESSIGKTLPQIAAGAAERGFHAVTSFAVSDEWRSQGASLPTNGHRYFIRPSLLPDSGGVGRWALEERLKPIQKMLAGNPSETGLRLKIPSAEVLLEYAVARGHRDFLGGSWSRTRNEFARMGTRLGGFNQGNFSLTLFPAGRLDASVGVCPVIEVEVGGDGP
jgi:hypothetical protein